MRSTKTFSDRRAFTLMEVIVALSVSAIVVLGAVQLLGAVTEATSQINRMSRDAGLHASVLDTVRELTERMDSDRSESVIFSGDARQMNYSTWCDVATGWQEPCDATIGIHQEFDGFYFRAVTKVTLPNHRIASPNRTQVLGPFSFASLRYLESARDGGVWFKYWAPSISVPAAIEIVLDRDTLLFVVGARS